MDVRRGTAVQGISRIACLSCAGLLACEAAVGQVGTARLDDFEQCRRPEAMVELRLKSCTSVIDDSTRITVIRAEAHLNRGIAREELGNLAEAIDDYTQGLKLNPEHRGLYHRRGLAYDQEGKSDLAIADFSHAIRLDPKDVEALIYRGLSYAALGDHHRAILDYDAALDENPDEAAVLAFRGESHEAIGDRERAKADFHRALKLEPGNGDAKAGLARLGG